MRSRASVPRALVLLVIGLVASFATGCSAYLAEEGDPTAPVLVRGRVVDASGGGMSGARVLVRVAGDGDPQTGAGTGFVYEGTFSAGLDGSFIVRLAPTPALVDRAGANGGLVTIGLEVFAGAAPFTFARELRDGAWAGAVPEFVFGPDGVMASSPAPS